jgi:hypothetical protein
MCSIDYVLVYCAACGECRKARPEQAYEPGLFEFPKLRASLKCPVCKSQMRPAPEYGQPTSVQLGLWPAASEIAWME